MLSNNLPKFNIKPDDYVLDIGGGHAPFLRTNIILDKFPETEHDQAQRANQAMVIPKGAKFVKADAANIPFKDKEFDFVFCAGTLNHIEDPMAVCKEIIRVGKRGYIETEGVLWELYATHPEHLWICMWDGLTLKFVKNNYPKNCIGHTEIKKPIIQEYCRLIRDVVVQKCIEVAYTQLTWEESFSYEIVE